MEKRNTKREHEIKLLQVQLQKEHLKVEIMQKELELKNVILEREQKLNILRI